MRKVMMTIVAAAVTIAVAVAPTSASAQAESTIPAAHIAVVNVQKIEKAAKAMQGLVPQIEQIKLQFQQELSAQDQALKAERQQLDNDRALLSPDLFRQRRQQLQEKIAAFQRTMQARTRQLDQGVGQARSKFHQALGKAIREVAGKYNANMVLQNRTIMFADSDLDITNEVLNRVDQTFPSVQLVISQN